MIIIIVAAILGIAAAIAFDLYIPAALSTYAAVVIISAADTVLGAYKALLKDEFSVIVFLSGFFGNSILASLMVFFGSKVGLDLYYAVIIVFTMRIFANFSFIKRYYIDKIRKKLKKC